MDMGTEHFLFNVQPGMLALIPPNLRRVTERIHEAHFVVSIQSSSVQVVIDRR